MSRNRPAARIAARIPGLIALFATLLVTLALLACGGGGDEETTESPTASPIPAATATATATAVPTVAATIAATSQPTALATTEATPLPAVPAAPSPRQIGDIEGITFQVGDGSEATFTVTEQLQSLSLPNDAVIRTNALTGHVSLDGGQSVIEIDLLALSSDSSFRDRYIRQRMFADTPTGVFTVQGLDGLPDGFSDGDTVKADVDGQLAIGSATTPLTFEVEARDDGDVVYLHGRTTFTWDQLGLGKPIAGPVVSLEDEVRVEVLVAARPRASSNNDVQDGPANAGSSLVLIVPPLEGNAQAFLDRLPEDEASCVSGVVPPDQLAAALEPDVGPAGPQGEALLGCLSDRTVVRIMLGGMFAMVGGLSPETETCMTGQLDDQAAVGQVAAQFRGQVITGAESPLSLFAMVPFMQCLSPEEATVADLGDPAQMECFVRELGPEGLASLAQLSDPAAGPPTALFQAAIKCGMGAGPPVAPLSPSP